jgi:CheY-like chemotaxis protein
VALSRALAQLFELVVSGLQNKSLGGFELTLALQATPRYANVPIVLTSVDADPELTRRAAACGARALVRKGSLQDEQLSQALRDISAQRAA